MHRLSLLIALTLTVQLIMPCAAQNCIVADPAGVLTNVFGDSEFTVDPDDQKKDLIYVSNVQDGKSQIVVAHIDGTTGTVLPGSLTTIADNFHGLTRVNGPEFVLPPGAGLGALYRAEDGVHGVFRAPSTTAWNDFHYDVDGNRVGKDPPKLKSTYRQSYDGAGMPYHQSTYELYAGPCSDRCFAFVRSGVPTDVAKVLSQQGLTVQTNWLTQSVENGLVLVKACATQGALTGTCGIYEARVDGKGGLESGSVRNLVTLPPDVGPLVERHPMAAARDPVTGTIVLFIPAAHETGQTIDVYEQTAVHRPFKLVGSAPVTSSDHYRIISDGRILLLHFIIFSGNFEGSYSLTVSAEHGQLEVGQSKLISTAAAGAEVEYLPAARSFAIFYVIQNPPNQLQRCFFQP